MRILPPGNVPPDIHSRCSERHRRLCDCDESQALATQALPVIVVNLGIANAVSFVYDMHGSAPCCTFYALTIVVDDLGVRQILGSPVA